MKFVLTSCGSRGDIEPCAALGRELVRRGHEVRMAVPPELVRFVESAGLATVAYGPATQPRWEAYRNFWTVFFQYPWRIRDLIRFWREIWEPVTRCWSEMSTTLMSLADGADLVFTGLSNQEVAANVAEYYNIPLVRLDYFPMLADGRLVPVLPSPWIRTAMTVYEWLHWRMKKKLEDTQRRELGLPKATGRWPRRTTESESLEIQAYDEVCFPGLADESAKWGSLRPVVGTLTMELPTDADDETASWVAAGTPPIYFGFGSMPVKSPADTINMIAAVCTQLGERALVCAGWSDLSHVPHFDHVKIVPALNFAATFPTCRAVVHHGGAGTTAAGLRAGVPTLILWMMPEQWYWGAQIKLLKVGTTRFFSSTTQESLVADLREILAPQYVTRAREIATGMTKPAECVTNTADLVENFARLGRVG
jgi:UDP:flavonoid glycosyltransferase YjiC (YdhE family)